MRYWFDTEFIEDGRTIELLSIGVVCEDGREFYAENAEADLTQASTWVLDNVVPHLHTTPRVLVDLKNNTSAESTGAPRPDFTVPEVKPRYLIARDLIQFTDAGESTPEFWAYYADYDWVVLCQLFGRMIDLPKGWPMYAMDVKQLCVSMGDPRLPEQSSTEHHALEDARWTKLAWEFLAERAHIVRA